MKTRILEDLWRYEGPQPNILSIPLKILDKHEIGIGNTIATLFFPF